MVALRGSIDGRRQAGAMLLLPPPAAVALVRGTRGGAGGIALDVGLALLRRRRKVRGSPSSESGENLRYRATR